MLRRTLLSSAAAVAATMSTSSFSASPERIIGLSLPKSGVQADVSTDFEIGYRLALLGGASTMKLLVLDDGGDPNRTADNVKTLAANHNVIALSGIVGTPHAQAAIPAARAAGLPLISIRSGASSLRDSLPGVIHMRSSYEDELDKIASMCAGAGLKSVAVIHSADSFGEGSRAHLVKALEKKGITTFAPIPVVRDGSNMIDATARCAKALSVGDLYAGVVLLMVAKPMVDAAKELRLKHRIALPIFVLSNVATRSVCTEVQPHLTGMGLVSAFPNPQSSIDSLSNSFRRDCDKFELNAYKGSLVSFEGWFYGMAIVKTDAQSRAQVMQKMLAGVTIADKFIKPGPDFVAYRHTEILRKLGDGSLRS